MDKFRRGFSATFILQRVIRIVVLFFTYRAKSHKIFLVYIKQKSLPPP